MNLDTVLLAFSFMLFSYTINEHTSGSEGGEGGERAPAHQQTNSKNIMIMDPPTFISSP